MSKRRKRGTHKNREAPTWSTPTKHAGGAPLAEGGGTFGTHRTAGMEDARARRIAKLRAFTGSKFDDDPDLCPVERPCARGTFGCSVQHRTGYERCETW
jgi:hypothetical protein